MNKKYELLAPAGNTDSVYAAVRCGADAVYVGGRDFSARANAVNFSDEELAEITKLCHLHGVKIYRAMNTVIFDSEAAAFREAVRYSAEIGMDGLIIQDLGGFAIAKELCDIPLHASTQMTIHTPQGALFARDMGFCRVVPSRELSLSQLKKICDTGVETEAFVHGALCMSVSGQCYMSAFIGSRSANRGQCAQACRLPFSATEQKERYDLSLKDMSYLYHFDEMMSAGIFSYKIEGRMKRAEYTAAAVTALKNAAEHMPTLDEDNERLKAVFSRSGFTDGYLTSNTGTDMFGTRRKDDVTAAADVLPELAELYRKERKELAISFRCVLRAGEKSCLTFEADGISGSVYGDEPEAARNRPTTQEDVIKQLSKLGDTIYSLDSIDISLSEGIIIPASKLNALRRECTALADSMIIAHNTPKYTINKFTNQPAYESPVISEPLIVLRTSAEVMNALEAEGGTERIKYILPLDGCTAEEKCKDRIYIEPPRFMTDEDMIIIKLSELKSMGYNNLYCQNISHLKIANDLSMNAMGGYGLNITNSYAAAFYAEYGLKSAVLSFELKATQAARISSPIPLGIYAYGNVPMMMTRNCPIKSSGTGCASCGGKRTLTDRTGRIFKVECSREYGYTEILNCDVLNISDKLSDFPNAQFILLDALNMDVKGVKRLIMSFRMHDKPACCTRGLYYRGII